MISSRVSAFFENRTLATLVERTFSLLHTGSVPHLVPWALHQRSEHVSDTAFKFRRLLNAESALAPMPRYLGSDTMMETLGLLDGRKGSGTPSQREKELDKASHICKTIASFAIQITDRTQGKAIWILRAGSTQEMTS